MLRSVLSMMYFWINAEERTEYDVFLDNRWQVLT